MSEVFYVKDQDSGQFYMEIGGSDNSVEYKLAESGLQFKRLANGKYLAVRDADVAREQKGVISHASHFGMEWTGDKMKVEDPMLARQRMKRLDVLERQMNSIYDPTQRIDPTGLFERITDEKYLDLHTQAVAAAKEGKEFPEFTP